MKKLLSLMLVCAAAFAGGGLVNEHNLTTMVNYLYHKQQIGRVISLGSIADTPPAELPETLPTTPGAITPTTPNFGQNAIIATPPAAVSQPAQSSTQVVSAQPVVPPPPMNQNPAFSPTPIPSSPPPPLSIHWPNESPTTYHAVPADSSAKGEAAPQVAGTTPVSPQPTPPVGTLGTPTPAPAGIPASIGPETVQQQPALKDEAVGRAGFQAAAVPVAASPPSAPAWEEVMQKMKESGVQKVEMTATPCTKLKLRCELLLPELQKPVTIESEGESPIAAGQLALKRIMLFKISRRSRIPKQAEPSASAEQDSGDAVTRLNTPRDVAPNPDSGLPPPPPADVPQ